MTTTIQENRVSLSDTDLADRLGFAETMAKAAGAAALDYFTRRDELVIETKRNPQDLVSEADKKVEELIRAEIANRFGADGVLGEEYGLTEGTSGLTWVIDPIDGTSAFLNGMPSWCVSVGAAIDGEPVLGVIVAPCFDECYSARRGGGATLNGKPIRVADQLNLRNGVVGLGSNDRVEPAAAARIVENLFEIGGTFIRNGSGALMLAYVAAGRLVGYAEPSMNAWDCMAGYCLVSEAGGTVLPFPRDGFHAPARVLAATGGSYAELEQISAIAQS
ncbi:inositol monophosphatase family protein [Nitratireductor kimnyeongensis]|uniref:Inositol monophosphatase family protein n=1 Tax=Nitratireductor kimnyeongensis TaxID=430679 RepID=A0ABW0T6P4_9HYPH|nr:inositol monophosphatase family protein [Nitratireductor kimnyeongensis]QZZ34467.1 inositol monophosphatase [Nitratireductor kimnyeongensis]